MLQITLRHFLSDPQVNGSEESSAARLGASSTQSDLPKAKYYSKKAQRERIFQASQVRKVTKRFIASKGKVTAKSRHREEGSTDERRSQHRGRDHHGHGSSSGSRR